MMEFFFGTTTSTIITITCIVLVLWFILRIGGGRAIGNLLDGIGDMVD